MPLQSFQASARLQQGVKVAVQARQFSLTLDEPVDLGGTDKGPNPVEALLGALGACQAIVARVYAQQFGVVLDGFQVEVEGDLDLDGFFGKAPVRPGFSAIRYRFHVDSPSPQVDIDRLISHLQSHCPVGDTLANPVPLSLDRVVVQSRAA